MVDLEVFLLQRINQFHIVYTCIAYLLHMCNLCLNFKRLLHDFSSIC